MFFVIRNHFLLIFFQQSLRIKTKKQVIIVHMNIFKYFWVKFVGTLKFQFVMKIFKVEFFYVLIKFLNIFFVFPFRKLNFLESFGQLFLWVFPLTINFLRILFFTKYFYFTFFIYLLLFRFRFLNLLNKLIHFN